MTRTTKTQSFSALLKPLTVAVAVAISLPAHAVRFDMGEVQGQFDSQMSVGTSIGTSDIDDDLIWFRNGGNETAAWYASSS